VHTSPLPHTRRKKNNYRFYLLCQGCTNSGRLFARAAKPIMVSPNLFSIITAFLYLTYNNVISVHLHREEIITGFTGHSRRVDSQYGTFFLHANVLEPRIFKWLLDFFFNVWTFGDW
jgi:hypothetical protein